LRGTEKLLMAVEWSYFYHPQENSFFNQCHDKKDMKTSERKNFLLFPQQRSGLGITTTVVGEA
jgi:hypothetical protein